MLTLRGFRDATDFDKIAQLRNRSARKHLGESAARVDSTSIEHTLSKPERLRIAIVSQQPVGYIFVARSGSPQLDEFATIEGKSWLVIGPTCDPQQEGKGIEERLLSWLVGYAAEMGIARLIKFAKPVGAPDYVAGLFENAGFRERIRYYHMQLEMAEAPPPPRELPGELELVRFRGEEDFDMLWSVLEPAFEYIERDAGSYEQTRAVFSAIGAIYFPICVESTSRKPVGTIATIAQGNRGQIATFGVIPDHQGQGIGSRLMERALDRAWHLGVRTVDLSVRVENPRAIGIYERFGFRVVPEGTTIVLLKEMGSQKKG